MADDQQDHQAEGVHVMSDIEAYGHGSSGSSSTSEHTPATAMRPGPPKGQRGKRTQDPKPVQAKKALKLSLRPDVIERLAIHGLRRSQTISDVVADLAEKHLTEWVIHARPGQRSEAS
jgi:hypothetical protein